MFGESDSAFSEHRSDERLIRRVRELGDKQAFEIIYKRYYKRLHGFARAFIREFQIAEDIIQNVFLKIWENKETWNPDGKLRHYLFTAVRNESLNYKRHARIVQDSANELSKVYEEKIDFDANEDQSDIILEIEKGINNLPPRCREIFLLNRKSGLTYTEIADYLGISINTVNTQMGRALETLRIFLSEHLSILLIVSANSFF